MVIIKKINIFFIIVVCVLILQGCTKVEKKVVYILEDESFFNEFKVEDEKVIFNCYIKIVNNTESDVKFKIKGDFIEDTKINRKPALVQQRYIYAQNKNKEDVFIIKSKQKQLYIVDFVGDFAGKEMKRNRLLPKLKIEVNNN